MEDLKNEKQQIHKRTNCLCTKANGNRNSGKGSDQQDEDRWITQNEYDKKAYELKQSQYDLEFKLKQHTEADGTSPLILTPKRIQ